MIKCVDDETISAYLIVRTYDKQRQEQLYSKSSREV